MRTIFSSPGNDTNVIRSLVPIYSKITGIIDLGRLICNTDTCHYRRSCIVCVQHRVCSLYRMYHDRASVARYSVDTTIHCDTGSIFDCLSVAATVNSSMLLLILTMRHGIVVAIQYPGLDILYRISSYHNCCCPCCRKKVYVMSVDCLIGILCFTYSYLSI